MNALSVAPRGADSVKSVSLADLQFGRPGRYDRLAGLGKTVLMLWGALSFGAAVGTAGYYLAGISGEPAFVGEARASAEAAAAPDASASLAEIPPPLAAKKVPATEIPKPLVAARLPHPRPDAPLTTGSIQVSAKVPPPSARLEMPRRSRQVGPCEALKSLGATLAFNIRCGREARAYPPPPRAYYVEPAYVPYPYVVE